MHSPHSIGVAVIGYGYWSPKLIRNLAGVEGMQLVAICEKDTTRHTHIQEEHPNIPVVQRYEEVFARKDIDAVIIATIPSSHFRIAKQALESGKHVLVEKPMVLTPSEGEMLMRIAKEKELTLMVDHTYLYAPAIQKLRELVRSGRLGKMYAVESTRINLGLFQKDTNVVWDLAPHDISIFLSVFDERPTHISVVGSKTVVHPKQSKGQESVAHMMLYYKSGFVAHVHLSWISPVKVRQITVIGSEQVAMYDQLASDPLRVFDQGVYPEFGESGPLFAYKTGNTEVIDLPKGTEDLRTMLQDFADGIHGKKTPISNAELGLDVVRILSAGDRSLRSGGKKTRISYTTSPSFLTTLREKYTRFRHHY